MKKMSARERYGKFLTTLPAMVLLVVCAAMLIPQLLSADVIYFKSGKMEQGYVETKGKNYRVRDHEGGGEFEFSTNLVEKIEYGIFFKDLDPKISSKTMTSVITNEPTVADSAPNIVTANWQRVESPSEKFDIAALTEEMEPALLWTAGIGLLILFILMIVSFACSIIVLVDAFKASVWWGLGYLFIPFVAFFYLIFQYTGKKTRMFLLIFSPFIFGAIWWWILHVYFPQVW